MQGLLTHTCLCRQVNGQVVRITAITVVALRNSGKLAKRQVNHIHTAHEGSAELLLLVATAVADDSCLCTIASPYLIAQRIVQLLQQKIVVSFFGSRQCTIVTYCSLECINSLGITTIISQSFISNTSCVNFRFTFSSIFYGTDSIDKALDIVCRRAIRIRASGNSTGRAVDRHCAADGNAGIAAFTYTVCSFTTFGRFQIFDTIRDSDVTALRFPTAVLCLSATDSGTVSAACYSYDTAANGDITNFSATTSTDTGT